MTDTQTAISTYQKQKDDAFTVNIVERLNAVCLQKFGDGVKRPVIKSLTVGRDVMRQLEKHPDLIIDPGYTKEHGASFMGITLKESPYLPAGGWVLHDQKGEIISMGNIYDPAT